MKRVILEPMSDNYPEEELWNIGPSRTTPIGSTITLWDCLQPELKEKFDSGSRQSGSSQSNAEEAPSNDDPEIEFSSPSSKQFGSLVRICRNASISTPIIDQDLESLTPNSNANQCLECKKLAPKPTKIMLTTN